ncbi:MAG: hypothetical protein HY901_31180 [Deltaproteobacteria bacterium]|nr:hypothetical protein [Deltaproteobacteria bacterium]
MTSWKIVFLVLMVLIPGGSLVLLALATAKALRASWDRSLRPAHVPVPDAGASNGGTG